MDKKIYLYVDEASRAILEDDNEKLILIGGDFGYANFGDTLQHLNCLNIVKKLKRFSTVSVMAVSAIGFKSFPAWARRTYDTDAIIFVSDCPLIFKDGDPVLTFVRTIRNPSVVHLYGGGFLNDRWGDFILAVAEFFLQSLPDVTYLASGQQITHPYENRVHQHIQDFQPAMFGVRDGFSRQWLRQAGFLPDFSFDDATEALLRLSEKMGVQRSDGLLLHLNVSDYTAYDSSVNAIQDELNLLAGHSSAKQGVTLLQAFIDPKYEVKDSRESIKLVDSAFPFVDYRTVELARLAYRCFDDVPDLHLTGDVGCSSSYHVALWLQLSGIPCWLRSANPFYDQKSKALQVHQDLQSFLEQPSLADHSLNLERRAEWVERFSRHLRQAPSVKKDFLFDVPPHDLQSMRFYFKGLPTLEERNQWQIGQTKLLETRLGEVEDIVQVQLQRADLAEAQERLVQEESRLLRERLETMRVQLTETGSLAHNQCQRADAEEAEKRQVQEECRGLRERLEAMSAQLTETGHVAHDQRQRADAAEVQGLLLQEESRSLRERLEAMSAQLTETGHAVHEQRERAEAAEAQAWQIQEEGRILNERLEGLQGNYQQMLQSRSWRLTRPMRAITRYFQHGYFDAQGRVGLYGIAQRIGRRLPVPAGIKQRIGRLMSKLRRQG